MVMVGRGIDGSVFLLENRPGGGGGGIVARRGKGGRHE